MSAFKKVIISEYGDYHLYYYDSSAGRRYYNFADKHTPMEFATDNASTAILGFIRRSSIGAFHARTWKYKTYKAMIDAQRECFAQTCKHVYRDLQKFDFT